MGLGKFWLKHGPGGPGSIAKAMARSYSTLRRREPGLSHSELLEAALSQRYSVINAASSAQQAKMLSDADGNMVELVLSIVRTENRSGYQGAVMNFSVYEEMLSVVEEVLEKHLPSDVDPRKGTGVM